MMRPRIIAISEVCGICLFSVETDKRCRLILCQPAGIEYVADSCAQSFSSAASELAHRRHWLRMAGLVRLARSMALRVHDTCRNEAVPPALDPRSPSAESAVQTPDQQRSALIDKIAFGQREVPTASTTRK